ncbi:MAG: 30S ribosomal protein S6 [bacterium]|nr:30S ribosomal protein S6 [bacterium]
MENHKEGIKTYELGYLLATPEAEKEVFSILQHNQAITFNQGKLSDVVLAYPINKNKVAHFGFAQFRADPGDVVKIKSAMVLHKQVLRSILLSVNEKLSNKKAESISSVPHQDKPSSERPVADSNTNTKPQILSNEALSEKLEEILK